MNETKYEAQRRMLEFIAIEKEKVKIASIFTEHN